MSATPKISTEIEAGFHLVLIDGVEVGHVRNPGAGCWRATIYRQPERPIAEMPTFPNKAAAVAYVAALDAHGYDQ